jgi:hypothetical protein
MEGDSSQPTETCLLRRNASREDGTQMGRDIEHTPVIHVRGAVAGDQFAHRYVWSTLSSCHDLADHLVSQQLGSSLLERAATNGEKLCSLTHSTVKRSNPYTLWSWSFRKLLLPDLHATFANDNLFCPHEADLILFHSLVT